MNTLRLGRAVRAARRKSGLRQVDVAVRAHVSQQTVSRMERGQIERLMVETVAAVAQAVGVEVSLVARYRGAELDRLLDQRHAHVVDTLVATLRPFGWELVLEYSFNHYGERGSVDVLAWHPEHKALLIIEVKTEIADIQDLLASHDRKARIVPGLVARERGWQPAAVGRVLVMPDDRSLRRVVARHAAIFDAALPARTVDVRNWLRKPDRPLRGMWFLTDTLPESGSPRSSTPRRARGTSRVATHPKPRSAGGSAGVRPRRQPRIP